MGEGGEAVSRPKLTLQKTPFILGLKNMLCRKSLGEKEEKLFSWVSCIPPGSSLHFLSLCPLEHHWVASVFQMFVSYSVTAPA